VITIKILGVTFTNGLSVIVRVQQLITSNDQALYARKFLRARALCETSSPSFSRAGKVFVCFFCTSAFYQLPNKRTCYVVMATIYEAQEAY